MTAEVELRGFGFRVTGLTFIGRWCLVVLEFGVREVENG